STASRKVFFAQIENDTVAMTLSFYPADTTGPEESLRQMRDNLGDNANMKKLAFSKTTTTIAGEKAQGYEFTCTIQGHPIVGQLHAARVGGRTVTVLWQALEEHFDSIARVADLARCSLTIEE